MLQLVSVSPQAPEPSDGAPIQVQSLRNYRVRIVAFLHHVVRHRYQFPYPHGAPLNAPPLVQADLMMWCEPLRAEVLGPMHRHVPDKPHTRGTPLSKPSLRS